MQPQSFLILPRAVNSFKIDFPRRMAGGLKISD
nr:MAG TPA: hypothetical protein [Caudoviricetes sp.]